MEFLPLRLFTQWLERLALLHFGVASPGRFLAKLLVLHVFDGESAELRLGRFLCWIQVPSIRAARIASEPERLELQFQADSGQLPAP